MESLVLQTEPCDEVLVVSDGPASAFTLEAVRRLRRVPGSFRLIEIKRAGDYGHTPRNVGYGQAAGDVLWTIDDDDQAAPRALEAIRKIEQPTIFRMTSSAGWTLWLEEEVRIGNVGTPMIAVPRAVARPAWGSRYEGDFDFALGLSKLHELVWREEIVALIRP